MYSHGLILHPLSHNFTIYNQLFVVENVNLIANGRHLLTEIKLNKCTIHITPKIMHTAW